MASIFTKIINGDIPCYKIYEDENYFAFLDISPLAKGHTLVVPKQEVDYIFDLSDEIYQGLMQVSKKIALAIQTAVPCKRIGVAVFFLGGENMEKIPEIEKKIFLRKKGLS